MPGQLNVSTSRPIPLFHTCGPGQLNVSTGRPVGQQQISSPPDNWSDPDKYTQLVYYLQNNKLIKNTVTAPLKRDYRVLSQINSDITCHPPHFDRQNKLSRVLSH